MGNVPSQDEEGVAEDQNQTIESRRKKSKHAKHAHVDEISQAIVHDDPPQLEDTPRRHKTKRHKSEKRRKKASKLDLEHSKEEESARTLLEMKGAAAVGGAFDQEGDLALSSQVAADSQNDGGSVLASGRAGDQERHKRKKTKRRKDRQAKEDNAKEEGDAVNVGGTSMGDTGHIDELLSGPYPGPIENSQPFHTIPESPQPPNGFTPSQRTAQDGAMSQTYGDVPAYADSGFRAGTPQYSPEASPSPMQPTEFQQESTHDTYAHRKKRKDSQTQDPDPQNGDTTTTHGRGKRRKVADSAEAHNALLADAASAANALIDPILTGQPPLWTIIDGKTAYMGPIFNGAPAESTRKGKKSGSKKKHHPLAGDSAEDGPATTTPKPKKRARTLVAPQPLTAAEGATASEQIAKTKGGPFSEHEENLLKRFMDDYRLEHGMSEYELNARVWAERRFNRDDFWDQVSSVLAYRPRQSIYKYCRRQFHNFPKRGQWTPEEDEELVAAAKEHPQQWKTVGTILNRMPEDCRDRWRNYLKCGEARNKDVWTEQEENRLKQHVREVIKALGGDKGIVSASGEDVLAGDDVDKKAALINWTIVSEKMGGTRSRIQCSYKWKKLQKLAAREKEQARANEDKAEVVPQPKKTWRAKRAEGNFFKMLPGDKYDLLKALKDSGTYEEKNIPWKLVGSPEFCKTWNLTDRKTAFKFLKQTVANHENMTLQDIVSELLKELSQYSPEVLALHYIAPPILPKRRKRSGDQPGEVTAEDASDSDLEYHQDASHSGYLPPQDRVTTGQGLGGQSGSYPHQLSMEEDRYLAPDVDERMAQQVQLLRNA